MKTLFFHRLNDYTGSTRALANMIERDYADQNISLVTIDIKKQGFLSGLNNVRIKRIYYPTINGKKIKLISYVISNIHLFFTAIICGFRFNTFYINTINPYPAVIAGWLLRKKIIYHIHEKFTTNNIEQKFLEFILDHTTATRVYVSNFVMGQYPNSNNACIVKYNKLPVSFTSKVIITSPADRPRCNIVMISSLTVAKGVVNFIELARSLPKYKFTLLLSADKYEIDAFFNNDTPQNVSIVSGESNIHPFLQKADLLLNLSIPSLWVETFGLTILEAMAYGIPSIVPNVGGPVELITDGYNGYCVDVTNIDIIKQKIDESLMLPNYDRLAANALERVKLFV